MLLFEHFGFDRFEFMTDISEAVARLHEPLPSGSYIYTRDIGLNLTTRVISGRAISAWFPTLIERWRSPDGSGRLLHKEYPAQFVSARSAEIWRDVDRLGEDVRIMDRPIRAGEFSTLENAWEGVMPLSDDPENLLRQLLSVSNGSAQALLGAVKEIYHDLGIVNASQRAALLRVLAGVKDLKLVGKATDKSGREIVGVSAPVDRQGIQLTLFLDPQTGELNGHQEVLMKRAEKLNLEPPGLLSYGERQAWGRTRNTGSRP